MSRSLKICLQVESGTIVAGYSAVAPDVRAAMPQATSSALLNAGAKERLQWFHKTFWMPSSLVTD